MLGDAPPSRQDTELSIGDLVDRVCFLFTPERRTIIAIKVHSQLRFQECSGRFNVEFR